MTMFLFQGVVGCWNLFRRGKFCRLWMLRSVTITGFTNGLSVGVTLSKVENTGDAVTVCTRTTSLKLILSWHSYDRSFSTDSRESQLWYWVAKTSYLAKHWLFMVLISSASSFITHPVGVNYRASHDWLRLCTGLLNEVSQYFGVKL